VQWKQSNKLKGNFVDYENLRDVINPEIAKQPREQLEATLESYNINAEGMENWLSSLGGIAKNVLPMVGTLFGGPVGAGLGALAGKAIGGLTGQPSAPTPSPQMPSVPMGAGMPPLPSGSPAAGQLMQTILRPETMQALMSMFLGPQLGAQNVQVGSKTVPSNAFTTLLKTLVNQAESEYNEAAAAAREALPEYLTDYAGEPVTDVAVAEKRAGALYQLLQQTEIEQESSEASEADEYARYESEMEAAESEYAAMDLADLYESAEDVSELDLV
jgi:hypothetical protein